LPGLVETGGRGGAITKPRLSLSAETRVKG
jgi:hypothetical protein